MVLVADTKGWGKMVFFSLIFFLFIFTANAETPLETFQRTNTAEIFNANGKKFSKVLGRTNRPKIVVDTVRFSNTNYASLDLNSFFTRGIHNVGASSSSNIFVTVTQILDDSTLAVNTYAAMPTDNGRRIIIKSSQSDDSSKVSLMIILN